MLASFVICFRDVLEAGLVIGVVLAATHGVRGRGALVAGGIAAGVAGSVLLAMFAGQLGALFDGMGQDVLNAAVLGVAAVMLGWHQLWMTSHGRQLADEMTALGRDVTQGRRSLGAMAVVVGTAVLREGAEVVLFLYGIAAAGMDGWAALTVGGLAGVCGGAAVSWLLFRGLVAIPLRRLFAVTGALITMLAAGMAGQSAAMLAGADLIPALGYQLWDTSGILPESSLLGRALHALVGYADRPMGVQLLAWATVLTLLLAGGRLLRRPARARTAAGSPTPPLPSR